jgi:outer membrane lipoprotein SlyB
MKRLLVLAAAVSTAAPVFAAPEPANAQSVRDYGSGDICRAEQRRSATAGAVIGGAAGAVVGRSVAADNARTEGTLLGAAVGAVAGHQIGKSRVKCVNYPRRVAARSNCRWVQEYYGGRNHDFEVCRGRDGVWRPSGRG